MVDFPRSKLVSLPDRQGQPEISLAVHEQGEGPAVVFCHGFPELAYSWRHQVPALAAAGYRAIAPDQRGYGMSSKPETGTPSNSKSFPIIVALDIPLSRGMAPPFSVPQQNSPAEMLTVELSAAQTSSSRRPPEIMTLELSKVNVLNLT